MNMFCDICHTEQALPNFAVCQKHYDQIMVMRRALDLDEGDEGQ